MPIAELLQQRFNAGVTSPLLQNRNDLTAFFAGAEVLENAIVILVSDHGFKHGELRIPESAHFGAKTGAMWHRQFGVFFAWGNGVKSGERITGATVFDVAPTILAAMGYPVPDDTARAAAEIRRRMKLDEK